VSASVPSHQTTAWMHYLQQHTGKGQSAVSHVVQKLFEIDTILLQLTEWAAASFCTIITLRFILTTQLIHKLIIKQKCDAVTIRCMASFCFICIFEYHTTFLRQSEDFVRYMSILRQIICTNYVHMLFDLFFRLNRIRIE